MRGVPLPLDADGNVFKNMSLRSQLTDILPAILPPNPAESIKGTELIRLVRLQLDGNYSDASLRYHFSIMSCDPGSPIAKVEKGQGYYRRTAEAPALSGARELLALTQGRLDDLTGDQPSIDNALLRVLKFRAVLTRHFETNGLFPFPFIQAFNQDSPIGNLWRFPDLVLANWETGEPPEEEMALDSAMLSLKQRLGLPPFRLSAARLRIVATLQSYREDFYQALAISHWAQAGDPPPSTTSRCPPTSSTPTRAKPRPSWRKSNSTASPPRPRDPTSNGPGSTPCAAKARRPAPWSIGSTPAWRPSAPSRSARGNRRTARQGPDTWIGPPIQIYRLCAFGGSACKAATTQPGPTGPGDEPAGSAP